MYKQRNNRHRMLTADAGDRRNFILHKPLGLIDYFEAEGTSVL